MESKLGLVVVPALRVELGESKELQLKILDCMSDELNVKR